MELHDEIAVLTALDKRVKAALAEKKAAWAGQARPKERAAAMLGDDELGTVTMTKGRQSWKVRDMKALLEWAMANNPDLVDYSAHIPDGTLRTLLKDPTTADGEVVPGVELEEGAPYPSFRAASGLDAVVSQAVRSGALSFSDVLAIES